MIKTKYSIELDLNPEDVIALQTFGGLDMAESVTNLAVSAAYMHRSVLSGMRGKLTVAEAKVLLTSLRGSRPCLDSPGKAVKEDVRMAVLLQDTSTIYGVSKKDMLERLDSFTPLELAAIEHWAFGYWHGAGAKGDNEIFDVYARYIGCMPEAVVGVTELRQ